VVNTQTSSSAWPNSKNTGESARHMLLLIRGESIIIGQCEYIPQPGY
jgi:hypothetical protein